MADECHALHINKDFLEAITLGPVADIRVLSSYISALQH